MVGSRDPDLIGSAIMLGIPGASVTHPIFSPSAVQTGYGSMVCYFLPEWLLFLHTLANLETVSPSGIHDFSLISHLIIRIRFHIQHGDIVITFFIILHSSRRLHGRRLTYFKLRRYLALSSRRRGDAIIHNGRW